MNLKAAALAASLVAVAGAASADPAKLRIGWVSATSDAPALIGKTGIAVHDGKSYTLDPIHFPGSPQQLTALATGDLDMVSFGFSVLPTAIINAKMDDLRVIADVFQDGVPGTYSNQFLVLNDSPIKTIADLKGKVAATNGAGSAVDMTLRAMLRKNGLEDKRDYSTIEVAFPNMPAVLKDHKADIVASTRAQTADPAIRAIARPLFTQRDALGRSQMAMVTARQGFLDKNRAVVIDYLEDSLRILHWYSDPANHAEVVKIFAQYTKLPESTYDSWLFVKSEDFYHEPDGIPALDALKGNVATQRDLGFVKSDFDIDKYVDLSYIKEASARLK
jgi:sulfonate transport system substrate-binding protein